MTTETPRGWSAQVAAGEISVMKMRQEIDRLKAEVKARDALIDSLNDRIERAHRKINHGCIGTYCKECDR